MKTMIKFVGSLRFHRGTKLAEKLPPLAAKTAHTRLGMESNWAWMIKTGNSIYAASSSIPQFISHISWKRRWASLSATHDQMPSVWDRFRDLAGQGSN